MANELEFDFIKSSQFRTIHVDGLFGGVGPTGRNINLAVFSERRAIPNKTVHSIEPNGVLGSEDMSRRESKHGIVRELEANLSIDLPTANAMYKWLGEKISELNAYQQSPANAPRDVIVNE